MLGAWLGLWDAWLIEGLWNLTLCFAHFRALPCFYWFEKQVACPNIRIALWGNTLLRWEDSKHLRGQRSETGSDWHPGGYLRERSSEDRHRLLGLQAAKRNKHRWDGKGFPFKSLKQSILRWNVNTVSTVTFNLYIALITHRLSSSFSCIENR